MPLWYVCGERTAMNTAVYSLPGTPRKLPEFQRLSPGPAESSIVG